jgi:uncharacterized protein (TIGR00251 family)
MAKLDIREKSGAVTFEVRVVPRSARSEIVGEHGGALKVKLTSPPVEGAANEELMRLLSKELGVARSYIDVVSGHASKTKRVRVSGSDKAKIHAILKQKS